MLFQWLVSDLAYVIFPQETYSTTEVENIWKVQWHGDLYFAHGSEHRRGVMVLIKASFDFKLSRAYKIVKFILLF